MANPWLGPDGAHSGYHGHWAQRFRPVNPHLGTRADHQALSDALHRQGLDLMQDLVVNHADNFFSGGTRWRADDRNAVQEAGFPMSGLDDLATDNPLVRRALRGSDGFWVREVGAHAGRDLHPTDPSWGLHRPMDLHAVAAHTAGGALPEAMTWHRRLRVGGWSKALFTHQGASATHEGTPAALGRKASLGRAPAGSPTEMDASAVLRLR